MKNKENQINKDSELEKVLIEKLKNVQIEKQKAFDTLKILQEKTQKLKNNIHNILGAELVLKEILGIKNDNTEN